MSKTPHLPLPEELRKLVPEELEDASIRGGRVHDPRASVRLNGPPGTGKTMQISFRLAYLIIVEDVDPHDITVITYQRELADKVERRLKGWGVIDDDTDLDRWSTAHAVANRVCGVLESAPDNDTSLGAAVTEREKGFFCSEVLGVEFSSAPWNESRGELLFRVFDWCANNLVDPTDPVAVQRAPEFDALREEWPGVDVGEKHQQWMEFIDRTGWVEFHEMLQAGIESERTPPCEVLVVDEFHDAYPILAKLCRRWVDEADTAIVAGDPLQVVNAYAGADPRFFTEQMDDIPEVLLDKSFRVPETIWQAASHMLRPEHTPPAIERTGERGRVFEHDSPSFKHRLPGPEVEASPAHIADKVVLGSSASERTMLLLARTRKQVKQISQSLNKGGIIHEAQQMSRSKMGQKNRLGWGNNQLFELHNALLKIESVPDSFAAQRAQESIVGSDRDRETEEIELSKSEAAALLEHSSAHDLELSASQREDTVDTLREDAEKISDTGTVALRDFDQWVNNGYWANYSHTDKTVRDNLIGLNNKQSKKLQRALMRYDAPLTVDELKQVRVMTIHASKGSEATDAVVYDGVTSKITSEMRRSEETRKNEARTWYVAFTRASERLHVMRDAFHWTESFVPDRIKQVAERRADAVLADVDSDGTGVTADD